MSNNNKVKPKNAIIWARVSTQEQAREGYSIDHQIERLTECCQRHNLTIFQTFKVQESSTKGEKKEFNRMINLVKQQKEKIVVLATKIDRLNRSMADLSKLEELVRMDNVELYFSENGSFDSNANSLQKMTLRMMTVFANSYNDTLSDYGKSTYEYKVRNGECPGPAPVGYLNVKDVYSGKSTVILDEIRAPLIKEMFEMYARGNTSIGELEIFAKKYNITNTFFKGTKKTLCKNVIGKMLQNSFYYGEIYSAKLNKYFPHKYAKLISQELFNACQDVRLGRKNTKYKRTMIEFALRGMVRCCHCDSAYSPELHKGKYVYMRPKPRNGCDKCFYVREELITGQIGEIIKQIHIPTDVLHQVKTCLKDLVGQKFELQMREINSLKNRLTQIKAKYDRLTDLLVDNSITKEDYDRRVIDLRKEEHEINNQLEQSVILDHNFEDQVINVFELANRSHELFKSSDSGQKRQIVNLLFPNLQMDGEKLVFTLQKPFDRLLKMQDCATWLPLISIFRTEKQEEVYSFIKNSYNKDIQKTRLIA